MKTKMILIIALGCLLPVSPSYTQETTNNSQTLRLRENYYHNLPWFQGWHTNFVFDYLTVGDYEVGYYRSKSGPSKKKTILFIHGTPEGPEIFWPVLVGDDSGNKLAADY